MTMSLQQNGYLQLPQGLAAAKSEANWGADEQIGLSRELQILGEHPGDTAARGDWACTVYPRTADNVTSRGGPEQTCDVVRLGVNELR